MVFYTTTAVSKHNLNFHLDEILFFDFSNKIHFFTIFIIIQSTLYYVKASLNNQLEKILSEIGDGQSITKIVDEKKIMDTLSIFEKLISNLSLPFGVITDFATFVFINILCMCINVYSSK